MKRAARSAVALSALAALAGACVLAAACSHANRPCPTRPSPAPRVVNPLADAVAIAAIESTGARFQDCSHEPALYVILREGKRELTDVELQGLQAVLQASGAGVEMAGIGPTGCPPPAVRGPGVQLWVRDDTVPPEALAHRLAAAVGPLDGEPTARIQVTVRSTPPPRCAASDPTCGPVPYKAACIERTDYDPQEPRKRVRGFGRPGECHHDGECFVAGCGNDCVPARGTDLAGTCELYTRWDKVYCGCVETECAWFTNP